MAIQRRTSAPVPGTLPKQTQAHGFSLPPELILPSQSQVGKYADGVASRIIQLDERAKSLGERLGISLTSFKLTEPKQLPGSGGLEAVVNALAILVHREERVSLERRNGRWGLYFTREPTAMERDRGAEVMTLRDAPLDVRERFLLRSEDFFREYLALCTDRLGRMKTAIKCGDDTIRGLDELILE